MFRFPLSCRVIYNSPQMRIPAYYRFAVRRRPQPRLVFVLMFALAALVLLFTAASQLAHAQANSKHLLIYTIDVEGGQSTLLVAPSGESLLVDTGWPSVNSHDPSPYQQGLHKSGLPDNNARDADRIITAMHDAGIVSLNYVLITHFHVDHVGGVPNLVKRVQVGEFLDHGPNREDSDITRHDYAAYLAAIKGKPRRIVHPGDTIDIPGLNIVVLTADGDHIDAVPGVKPEPNPWCATEPHWALDQTENPRSAGILVRYGKFRFLDLGDLTKAKEIPLVCPDNLIGHVGLYLVNHHGMDLSNSRAFVFAIHPRVAIMDNGAHKAGMPEAWQTVHDSPGIQALYMLHYAEGSDAAHNSPAAEIANLKGGSDGNYFKVVANEDGSFSVTNSRTGKTDNYPAR